jgi:hypothetical protein
MVLGAMGSDVPVCFYCNKPGHVKRDCYKLRNDLAGRGNMGNNRGGNGGRHGGRPNGGRQLYNNAVGEGTMDVQEVMRLGLAAVANKTK